MNMIRIALVATAIAIGTGGAFAESQKAGGGFHPTRNDVTVFGKSQTGDALGVLGLKASKPTIFGHMVDVTDVRARETQNR